MPTLSLRLKTIASLVPSGARVCDVGTDHALLPIHLKQKGIANTVIATDLNQKPIKNAQKNIDQSGISGISLRLCDGLSAVRKNEADTIIIAGIGGQVISGILENCDWIKTTDLTLILQPTTSPEVLRRFLAENGFEIVSETPILENQKIYSVILAKFSNTDCSYPEYFYYIGKVPKTAEGIIYIKKQQNRLLDCIKALENSQDMQKEFLQYKVAYEHINNFLTETD